MTWLERHLEERLPQHRGRPDRSISRGGPRGRRTSQTSQFTDYLLNMDLLAPCERKRIL